MLQNNNFITIAKRQQCPQTVQYQYGKNLADIKKQNYMVPKYVEDTNYSKQQEYEVSMLMRRKLVDQDYTYKRKIDKDGKQQQDLLNIRPQKYCLSNQTKTTDENVILNNIIQINTTYKTIQQQDEIINALRPSKSSLKQNTSSNMENIHQYTDFQDTDNQLFQTSNSISQRFQKHILTSQEKELASLRMQKQKRLESDTVDIQIKPNAQKLSEPDKQNVIQTIEKQEIKLQNSDDNIDVEAISQSQLNTLKQIQHAENSSEVQPLKQQIGTSYADYKQINYKQQMDFALKQTEADVQRHSLIFAEDVLNTKTNHLKQIRPEITTLQNDWGSLNQQLQESIQQHKQKLLENKVNADLFVKQLDNKEVTQIKQQIETQSQMIQQQEEKQISIDLDQLLKSFKVNNDENQNISSLRPKRHVIVQQNVSQLKEENINSLDFSVATQQNEQQLVQQTNQIEIQGSQIKVGQPQTGKMNPVSTAKEQMLQNVDEILSFFG